MLYDFKVTRQDLENSTITVHYKRDEIVSINACEVQPKFVADFMRILQADTALERTSILMQATKDKRIVWYLPIRMQTLLTKDYENIDWENEYQYIVNYPYENIVQMSLNVPYCGGKIVSLPLAIPDSKDLDLLYK